MPQKPFTLQPLRKRCKTLKQTYKTPKSKPQNLNPKSSNPEILVPYPESEKAQTLIPHLKTKALQDPKP